MAKLERTIHGQFDRIQKTIMDGVLGASTSASLEDIWVRERPNARCATMVFERYSWVGSNRVSMTVTLFQAGEDIDLCAITAGGSQAMFVKINTLGEEAFLDTLRDVVDNL